MNEEVSIDEIEKALRIAIGDQNRTALSEENYIELLRRTYPQVSDEDLRQYTEGPGVRAAFYRRVEKGLESALQIVLEHKEGV